MTDGVDFIFNAFATLFVFLTSNVIFSSFLFVSVLGWIVAFFVSLRSK